VNRKLVLTVSGSPDADQAWDLWAGFDRRTMALQTSGTNLQGTVELPGPLHAMTEGMPEAAVRRIMIAAKHVWHSGVAGVAVSSVTAPNQIQSDDFKGSTDNWVDAVHPRILSALADFSDGSAPLWNFQITAFDSSSGTFTVAPDCVRAGAPEDSVEEGDVLIVRSQGIAATASSVQDPLWNNSIARNEFNSPGLAPGEERGRIARILFGTGAGQYRYITDNDATTLYVSPDWSVLPDATSILIVEAPDWSYTATTSSDLAVSLEGSRVEIKLRAENLRDLVALVAGFLVDDQGRATDESVAPMREIFLYGQPPTVREIGPEEFDPDGDPSTPWQALATDHTIRALTTTNTVQLQLPPLNIYQGRPLLVLNDNPSGQFDVVVLAFPGEVLFDGNTSVRVQPGQSLRLTAG